MADITPRQSQICKMVVQGLGNKQIAKLLGISHRTIEYHKRAMYEAYDVHNAVELTRFIYDIKDED